MSLEDRLQDAFDRGFDDDGASLSPADLALYRAWRFIIDWQMGGLSSYLYNTLPDLGPARSTVKALKTVGLVELAGILAKGVALFKGYKDPDSPSTWGEILKKYDPKNQLDGLDTQIAELENFGIDSAKAKRTKASTKATKRASPKKVRGRAASAKKTSVAKKSLITTRASPVQSAWKRIDSWLNHNAPARAKSLARGVTVTQITAIESQIGRPLPEEFKESYSEHDGQKDDLPVIPDPCGPLHFLRVKAIIREWKYCAYMADSGEFEDVSIKADKGVARDWWNPGWIPFATNGCGDYLCIDLAPTKSGASGQVIRMQEDEPERSLLASSFRTWLEQLADALEHGELEILY